MLFKAAFSSETCFACLFCLDTFLFLLRVYKFLSATSLNLDLLFFDSGWLVLKKGVSSMLKGVAPKIFSRASPETPIFTRFAHNPPPPTGPWKRHCLERQHSQNYFASVKLLDCLGVQNLQFRSFLIIKQFGEINEIQTKYLRNRFISYIK